MKLDIMTIFPAMFEGWCTTSIIKRAISKQLVSVNIVDFRPYTKDQNNRIDDYPYGGGAGLVMQIQPITDCLKQIKRDNTHVVLMSPRGKKFDQKRAHEFAKMEHIILISGHYEGVDERINEYVDEVISIGDFILTGGELPSMVICDAIIRLIEGVISENSPDEESFENGLLEYPQYTIPRVYDEKKVPDILFSGNHKAIQKWRLKESLRITKEFRPELLINREFSKVEKELLIELEQENDNPEWLVKAIGSAKKFMEEPKK